MKMIFLVRHGAHAEVGHVLSGRSEIALSSLGRAQAEALAVAMEGAGIRSLHSSPRRRARETITPLADRLALPIQTVEALDEVDFGRFTGKYFNVLDADPAWQFWNDQRDKARCPGGETMAEAVERALAYLRNIPPEATPALCVTHCDIIRGILAMESGLAGLFSFDCDPGSVTQMVLEGHRIQPLAINLSPPIEADQRDLESNKHSITHVIQ